ncbi:MAG: hypothetical protein ACRDUA_11300 [Micromonosporaceae bacterium]
MAEGGPDVVAARGRMRSRGKVKRELADLPGRVSPDETGQRAVNETWAPTPTVTPMAEATYRDGAVPVIAKPTRTASTSAG